MKANIQQAIDFVKAATGQVVSAEDIHVHYNGRIEFLLPDETMFMQAFSATKSLLGEPHSTVLWSMADHKWLFSSNRSLHLYCTGQSYLIVLFDAEAR